MPNARTTDRQGLPSGSQCARPNHDLHGCLILPLKPGGSVRRRRWFGVKCARACGGLQRFLGNSYPCAWNLYPPAPGYVPGVLSGYRGGNPGVLSGYFWGNSGVSEVYQLSRECAPDIAPPIM